MSPPPKRCQINPQRGSNAYSQEHRFATPPSLCTRLGGRESGSRGNNCRWVAVVIVTMVLMMVMVVTMVVMVVVEVMVVVVVLVLTTGDGGKGITLRRNSKWPTRARLANNRATA